MFEDKTAQSEAGLPRDVYALLAQANLLRMRGRWDDAVDRGMAALRLSPDSPSALSLLGDIYENQGRYDDAEQWYRMALDVQPDSPADRLKLDLLRRMRSEPVSVPPEPGGEDIPFVKTNTPDVRRGRPEFLLRFATAAAALILLLVIGMAFVATHSHAALATLGLSPNQEMKLKPIVVSSAPTGSAPSLTFPHDPEEQALLDALRASPDLSAEGITVLDVQSDPRTGQAAVTFEITSPPGGLSRALTVQQSARVLQTAASQPGEAAITVFTARCLAAGGNGNSNDAPVLVFVGDLPQTSVSASNSALSDSSLQALFSNLWWSPQVPS